MAKIIYPAKVEIGANIGVTAMSSGLGDDRGKIKLENARKNFINKGFQIVETDNVKMDKKLVSSSSIDRANQFLELLEREDIPYIIIACGGEFLMETIPFLHENKEKILNSKPKWIQGFSDVSLLNFYLTTNYNIATIHANSFSSFAMIPWDKSLKTPVDFVQNPSDFMQNNYHFFEKERDRSPGAECNPYNLTEKVVYKNLYEGDASFSGRIIGGCVDVLKVLLGTPFDNTKNFCNSFEEGMVWYLENCEMPITDMKRTLWQMKMAGWFENAKGFIFGRTNSRADIGDFTYEDALHDILDDLKVPVIYDVDFGHVAPQWTIINGAFAEFEYSDGEGKLNQIITR